MSENEGARRLADAVRIRRVEVGFDTAKGLAEAAGLSSRIIGEIENARRTSYRAATLWTLDRLLGWTRGSAQGVLDGGEPTLAPEGPRAAPASARGESAAGSSSSSGGGVVALPASVVEGLSDAELDEVQSVARAAALRRAREIAAARREAEALPDFSQMAARTVKRRPQWDEAQDGSDAGEESQDG